MNFNFGHAFFKRFLIEDVGAIIIPPIRTREMFR